jgi:hypothetical protein
MVDGKSGMRLTPRLLRVHVGGGDSHVWCSLSQPSARGGLLEKGGGVAAIVP